LATDPFEGAAGTFYLTKAKNSGNYKPNPKRP